METRELAKNELITIKDATLGEVCAVKATNREALVAYINRFVVSAWFDGKEGKPYLHVELSGEQLGCEGCSVDYATEVDIPCQSVPCQCGNPNHWLIKYENK
ncbi:hypothetical protein KKE60_06595 [Patescibacteria group bacterium]|nr:hypothetical protein [Patescibacteria group bacterium]